MIRVPMGDLNVTICDAKTTNEARHRVTDESTYSNDTGVRWKELVISQEREVLVSEPTLPTFSKSGFSEYFKGCAEA